VRSNSTASDSTLLTIIEIRGLCNPRTGEIKESAMDITMDIIKMFSNANETYHPGYTGITIEVGGGIPYWCKQRFKKFSDGVSVRISTQTITTTEDTEDDTDGISRLCAYLFDKEHKVYKRGAEAILASSKKDEVEDEVDIPSYSHQNYLQKKIKRTYFNLLAVKWENSNDLIITLSILEYFHEKNDKGRCKSRYDGDDLIGSASEREIRGRTNLSRDTISRRAKYLHFSNYPLTIIGDTDIAESTRYQISPVVPERYLSLLKKKEEVRVETTNRMFRGFYPIIIMAGLRTLLCYSPLSSTQIHVILLLLAEESHSLEKDLLYITTSDLVDSHKHGKDRQRDWKNFDRNTIGILKKKYGLITEDKGWVSLVPDIEESIMDLYDEDRYIKVQDEIAKQQENYKEVVAYGNVRDDVRQRILRNRAW
jgi:hypothetical protein